MNSNRACACVTAITVAATLAAGCAGSSAPSSVPSTSPSAAAAQPAAAATSAPTVPADYPTGTWIRVGHDPKMSRLTFGDSAIVRVQDFLGFNDEGLTFPGPHRLTFGRSLGGDTYCTVAGTYRYRMVKRQLHFRPVGKDPCNPRRIFLGHYVWKLTG